MRIIPVNKTRARAFVNEHHRHNEAPTNMQVSFAVGVEGEDGELVAVLTAGHPVARGLADGYTLEVNRLCVAESVDAEKNLNSQLYGAIGRAAKALGYHRLVTYTLQSESGASLKAAGFDGPVDIGARSWADENDPAVRPRYDQTLFGPRNNAANEPKYRWERWLVQREVA